MQQTIIVIIVIVSVMKQNFALRQNSTRQEKTRLPLEAFQLQRGSISFTAPSFEGMPREVTAPPSLAYTAPLEHLKSEELRSDNCLGLRDVKMMKKQPLVIVAVNVMQPNGPVLPQRRSSYQRILALENEQLQIVERERHLPIDLILSPSTCLIVYTAATMNLNWEKNPGVASKECSAFIADILVNCQMKAMSFSFEKCFMVRYSTLIDMQEGLTLFFDIQPCQNNLILIGNIDR